MGVQGGIRSSVQRYRHGRIDAVDEKIEGLMAS
jgi:hypothetical protein